MKNFKFAFGGVAVALLFLCVGFCFAACGHTHTFGDWVIEKEVSCTENGARFRVCQDCGEKETEVLLAGHVVEVTKGFEATCDAAGLSDGEVCTRCGETLKQQVSIPELGHDYGEWTPSGDFVVDKCNGTHYKECSRCHDKVVDSCEYQTIEEHEATCEEGGYHVHYCPTCKNKFKHGETKPLGHEWINEYEYYLDEDGTPMHRQICGRDRTHRNTPVACDETTVEVTQKSCTQKGFTKHTCKFCKHEWETDIEPAIGHNWQFSKRLEVDEQGHYHHELKCANCQETETQICEEEENYTPATCTEASKRILTCKVCSRVREDEEGKIEALGHEILKYEHYFHDGTHKHSSKCERCKEMFYDDCKFVTDVDSSKAPTCKQPGVTVEYCETCKFIKSKTEGVTEHKWSSYVRKTDNAHIRVCENCGVEDVEDCTFSVIDEQKVSCTQNGKITYRCDFCEQEITRINKQALGHLFPATVEEDISLWVIDADAHTRKCARCGEPERRMHRFVESNLCETCHYDGLKYEVVDGHAELYDNSKVRMAKNIIIAKEYEGVPVTLVYSKFNKNSGTYSGFYNNQYMETLLLPQSLVEIGESCFSKCSKLKVVSVDGEGTDGFKPSLKKIGANAFAYCTNLQTANNLPSGLEHIGAKAFYDCKNLDGVTIPDSVLEIGDHAFTNTAFLNNLSSTPIVYVNKHLLRVAPQQTGTITVKAETVSIAAEAFKNCAHITKVVLPNTIKEIGENAFLGCEKLAEVEFNGTFSEWFGIVFENDFASPMSYASKLHISNATGVIKIPYGVTKIPAGTFKGSQVTEIQVPETVTYIGEEAFENCTTLTKISIVDAEGHLSNQRNWQYVGLNAFSGINTETNTLDGLVVDACGVLYFDVYLLDASGLNTENYTVKSGTKSISPQAFYNCTKLKNLTINAELVYIGAHAFVGCDNLNYLKFENPNNWFAYTDFYLGRIVDAKELNGDGNASTQIRDYYVGEWKKANLQFSKQ